MLKRVSIAHHKMMSLYWLKPAIISSIVLSLAGCSLFNNSAVNNPPLVYDIAPLTHWTATGRMAIHSAKNSATVNFTWRHTPTDDQLKLSGPLGQGATHIDWTAQRVTLNRGNGLVQTSAQPEQLIQQQLGINVPVNALRYWLQGLPEPIVAQQHTAQGFQQEGWQIEYPQWQTVNQRMLPQKIVATHNTLKLKLIIEQWTF
jgi:outer membrane lipoprotein LolB